MPTIDLIDRFTGFDEYGNYAYRTDRVKAVQCDECGKPARKTWTVQLDYEPYVLHFHARHCRIIDY